MCGRGDPALPDEAHGDTEHPCNQYIPVEIWNLLGDLEDREKSRPKYDDRADDYSQSQDRVRRSATYSRAPTSRSSADNRATSRGRQRQYASPPSGPSCPEVSQRSNADSLGYQSREEGEEDKYSYSPLSPMLPEGFVPPSSPEPPRQSAEMNEMKNEIESLKERLDRLSGVERRLDSFLRDYRQLLGELMGAGIQLPRAKRARRTNDTA
jgi:hypothetical protein